MNNLYVLISVFTFMGAIVYMTKLIIDNAKEKV